MRIRYTFAIDVEHEDYNSLEELYDELNEFRAANRDILALKALLYDPELNIDIELTSVEEV